MKLEINNFSDPSLNINYTNVGDINYNESLENRIVSLAAHILILARNVSASVQPPLNF
jgi:hypothetical protein